MVGKTMLIFENFFYGGIFTMARFILNETSYFGAGCRSELATEIKARGFKKALVVTDKDLVKFGVFDMVKKVLDDNKIEYALFDDVKANPTVKNVKDGLKAFRDAKADCLVAIGGGSVIDTTKAIGIIIENPAFEDVVSLEGVAATTKKCVPTIALPTTAGTAAETTINYVIIDEDTHRKMVCVDVHDIPDVAIIDAELMASMPKGLTAATGMDALTHAIESYITPGAWEMSDMMEYKAIELIATHLRNAVANGKDMAAREGMALGQYIAGMGFSNVGLGIAHSMAHPLSARFDVPHGVACAMLLPTVMAYNAESASKPKYRGIAKAMGVEGVDKMSDDEAAKAAIDAVQKLSDDVNIPKAISQFGITEKDLDQLSKDAFADVCTGGNPRPTSVEEIKKLYEKKL